MSGFGIVHNFCSAPKIEDNKKRFEQSDPQVGNNTPY